jgi:hypothetical protein
MNTDNIVADSNEDGPIHPAEIHPAEPTSFTREGRETLARVDDRTDLEHKAPALELSAQIGALYRLLALSPTAEDRRQIMCDIQELKQKLAALDAGHSYYMRQKDAAYRTRSDNSRLTPCPPIEQVR